MIMFCCPLCSS